MISFPEPIMSKTNPQITLSKNQLDLVQTEIKSDSYFN